MGRKGLDLIVLAFFIIVGPQLFPAGYFSTFKARYSQSVYSFYWNDSYIVGPSGMLQFWSLVTLQPFIVSLERVGPIVTRTCIIDIISNNTHYGKLIRQHRAWQSKIGLKNQSQPNNSLTVAQISLYANGMSSDTV